MDRSQSMGSLVNFTAALRFSNRGPDQLDKNAPDARRITSHACCGPGKLGSVSVVFLLYRLASRRGGC